MYLITHIWCHVLCSLSHDKSSKRETNVPWLSFISPDPQLCFSQVCTTQLLATARHHFFATWSKCLWNFKITLQARHSVRKSLQKSHTINMRAKRAKIFIFEFSRKNFKGDIFGIFKLKLDCFLFRLIVDNNNFWTVMV